jgi:hypothetical protein
MPSLTEIRKALVALKAKGYVRASRKGPTGVGHTLEARLGVGESNIQIPDLGGRVELKATRRHSSSLITLFTFNRGVWLLPQREVIGKYGYSDRNRGRKALYSAVRAGAENPQGLVIHVNRSDQTISVMHRRQKVATWSAFRLAGALLYKLGVLVYVIADSRVGDSGEEFHFNEAYLLKEPSSNRFLEAFEKSLAFIDLRMHLRNDGSVRNHGTGFRMHEHDLYLLFKTRERLI